MALLPSLFLHSRRPCCDVLVTLADIRMSLLQIFGEDKKRCTSPSFQPWLCLCFAGTRRLLGGVSGICCYVRKLTTKRNRSRRTAAIVSLVAKRQQFLDALRGILFGYGGISVCTTIGCTQR